MYICMVEAPGHRKFPRFLFGGRGKVELDILFILP
jgi:hypothetical protein